jgi:hypothetical protein
MKKSKSEAGKMGAAISSEIAKLNKQKRIEIYNQNPNKCGHCDVVLPYIKRKSLFCSSSCAASKNNTLRVNTQRNLLFCKNCQKQIGKYGKYCSIRCQKDYEYKERLNQWLSGFSPAGGGLIKRYLTDRFGYFCSECGISNYNNKPIVLEIEHKDGNSTNNQPDNVCFLCPNCHSQTDTYKAKNRGNGRHSRRIRYAEGKSY